MSSKLEIVQHHYSRYTVMYQCPHFLERSQLMLEVEVGNGFVEEQDLITIGSPAGSQLSNRGAKCTRCFSPPESVC